MSASKHPITFGFRAKDGYYYGPNGVVAPFHHGEDRAMPEGVPVVVAGVTMALSGNTGATSGPHLHTDKRPIGSSVANRYAFVNPADWVSLKRAKVVHAGYAGTAGHMVSLQSNGYEYRFLHLSKINVKVGQTIALNKEYKLDDKLINIINQLATGKDASAARRAYWRGKDPYTFASKMLKNSQTVSFRNRAFGYDALKARYLAVKDGVTKNSVIEYIKNKLT